ncbi:MAG TPA: KTSC domain-containing protein [Devosia sp.]|nr:KTSC domain-containing protein [Devosia sp.]
MPSTLIRKTSYDDERRVLSVWFVPSGSRYDYEDVPPELYAAMRRALSKGSFFNTYIRNHYAYRRVDDDLDE